MLHKSILLLFWGMFILQSSLHASAYINLEDHPTAAVTMHELIPDPQPTRSEISTLKKEEHHLVRIEKFMKHMNKVLNRNHENHKLGGISDPVDKWFWIWAITWGTGILLTLILGGSLTGAAIGIIWLAAFAIGSISLILWLLKKYR